MARYFLHGLDDRTYLLVGDVLKELKNLSQAIIINNKNQTLIMSAIEDLQAKVDGLTTTLGTVSDNVAAVDTHVQGIADDIAKLQSQIANPAPAADGSVTFTAQEIDGLKSSLDGLAQKATSLSDATAAIKTSTENLDAQNQ